MDMNDVAAMLADERDERSHVADHHERILAGDVERDDVGSRADDFALPIAAARNDDRLVAVRRQDVDKVDHARHGGAGFKRRDDE